MTALTVGTYASITRTMAYTNVGTVTKGPYLHSDSVLLGMSVSIGDLVVDSYGDATCQVTISGTPTSAGTLLIYILVDYNQLSNGEAVVGNDSYKVQVVEEGDDVLVESIMLSVPDDLYVGDSVTITATVSPSEATNQTVAWSASGSGSVTLSASGTGSKVCTIYGVSAGSVTLVCSATDSSGVTNSRNIAVNAESYVYTLYFSANGGTGAPDPLTDRRPNTLNKVSFSVPYTKPTRSGYRFVGWSWSSGTDPDDIETGCQAGKTVYIDYPSATLYAIWSKNKEDWYTYLKFDANGGTGAPDTMVSVQDSVEKPTGYVLFTIPDVVPTRSGREFIGWDERGDSTIYLVPGNICYVPKCETVTLYAVWSQVITLDANGGTFSDGSTIRTIDVTSDSTLTFTTYWVLYDAETPTKAPQVIEGSKTRRYTFSGWYTAASGGTRIDPLVTRRPEGDHTLYAQYTSSDVESEGTGENDTPQAGMSESILISDNTGDTFYSLLGRVEADGESYFYNCISSLSITGGPEDPFEYLTIVVPKKRLEYVASELVEANGILPGVTKVQLDCMGRGMFTVTKCRYSGRRYTITAYCDAERFRGATNDKQLTGDPWTIIMEILGMRSSYGISISYLDTEDLYDPSVAARCTESLSFEADTNLWYILQVCAMLCRCRIWFSDDTVHIRDCTTAYTNRTHPGTEVVDLYPEDEGDAMYARVVDEVDLGDEGSDTVVNSVTIRCANATGTMTNIGPLYGDGSTSKPSSGSVAKFGERTESLSIPELVWRYDTEEGETATADTDKVSDLCALFAQSYIAYLSEPQQSIEFTVKEMQLNEKGDGYEWLSYFDDPSMASEIIDVPDEVHLTNESVCGQGTLPQKLMLSTRTRHYPNRTTTYTFGQMKSITLSDSTSRIMDALNKG